MNSIVSGRLRNKHIFIGLQVLIMILSIGSWLFHRGSADEKIFSPEECIVSESASAEDTVSIDSERSGGGIFLSTPLLQLKKGIYQVRIDYSADCAGTTVSASSDLGVTEMRCPPVELNPAANSAALYLDLSRSTDQAAIHVSFSGEGQVSIKGLALYETSYRYKKNIFYAFLLCLFINFGWLLQISRSAQRKILLALSGIFLLSCYPLYTDFLTIGHDLPFHLLRIEAISQGLSHGSFPVKLHPLWAKGYGYAAGIFYGDALLYFPALLRLAGFSVQTAYKFFAAFVNLGTVLLSYYSFRKIFSQPKLGLLGCLAYTLSPYRLMDMYTRASVGEYTAMMFLPLVLCGFYLIFRGSSTKYRLKYAVLTAIGMSGLIHSHVLSSLMAAFVLLTACFALFRRFSLHTARSLAAAAGLTLAMSLNFILPFLDFYREDIMIKSPQWTGSTIGSFQSGGLFPIQLFTLFQQSNGGAWATVAGISTEPTFGIGIFLTIGLLLFVYLLCVHRSDCRQSRDYYPGVLCTLLGCLLLYMCTCYFPWDALCALGRPVKKVIYSLEFPWRLLAPATLLLTFTLCCAFDMAKKILPGQWRSLLTFSLALLAVNCGWYFYDFAFSGEPYRVYNTHELNTMQMYSYDYLPAGTDPEAIQENAVYSSGIDSLESYQKHGTTITCQISADSEDAYVEFPLMYYKYYRCRDIHTGEELSVRAGTNNMIRVNVPSGYSGSIRLRFEEPWFWRLAEILSSLALVCCCTFIVHNYLFRQIIRRK